MSPLANHRVLAAAADLCTLVNATCTDCLNTPGEDRGVARGAARQDVFDTSAADGRAARRPAGRDVDGAAVGRIDDRSAGQDIQCAATQDDIAGVGLARRNGVDFAAYDSHA